MFAVVANSVVIATFDTFEDAAQYIEDEENLDEYRWYKNNLYESPARDIINTDDVIVVESFDPSVIGTYDEDLPF